MITNKDIRVENGNLVLNGDKFPLDGQSPEAIMDIVEDNSDTTPTASSDNPVTSNGIKTYVDNIAKDKVDVITSSSRGTTQTLSVGVSPTNRIYLLSVGYSAHYAVGVVVINSDGQVLYTALATTGLNASVSYNDGVISISLDVNPYSNACLIRLS